MFKVGQKVRIVGPSNAGPPIHERLRMGKIGIVMNNVIQGNIQVGSISEECYYLWFPESSLKPVDYVVISGKSVWGPYDSFEAAKQNAEGFSRNYPGRVYRIYENTGEFCEKTEIQLLKEYYDRCKTNTFSCQGTEVKTVSDARIEGDKLVVTHTFK